MTSSSADPFPMTSEAAKQMAASTQSLNDSEWKASDVRKETLTSNQHKLISMSEAERGSLQNDGKIKSMETYMSDSDEDDDEDEENEFLFTKKKISLFKSVAKFVKKVFRKLYGDIDFDDLMKSLSLSMTLFFLIGGYWLLRSLKDPVLTALCGVEAIPRAKMLSVFIVLGVVFVYNKFIDFVQHNPDNRTYLTQMHELFYVFGTFYFILFGGIAYLLADPEIGLANQVPNESRLLGWISYCSIESFGSVMVALFWSFVNSNVSLEAAKQTYGFIVAAAQIGSILGPTVVQMYSTSLGIPTIYFLGACCMLILQGTIYVYIKVYGVSSKDGKKDGKKKEKAGILEGLQLFYDHNYIKGIFAISCLFMILVTIVDYTLKFLARDHFSSEFECLEGMACFNALGEGKHGMSMEASQNFASFMGLFGQATNTLSFTLSLFGTSAVIRTLGLRLTLLMFPSLCLCVILFVRMDPTLWVVFLAMMVLKACSYSLNNPTKEILYQPTNQSVKYKAKSWIDIFGARGSKALGSVVTNYYSYSATALVSNGSLVGIAVAVFLIWNARYMGNEFERLTENGIVIGDNEEEATYGDIVEDTLDDAANDTSCGLEEEGQSEHEDGDVMSDDEEAR